MEHASGILLLSLKQDLKTLSEVVQNIEKHSGNHRVNSWLYPTKPHSFIRELINDTLVGLGDFRSYLELIVDRLYVGIQLILNHIESIVRNTSYRNRLVQRPKQVTLGFCFQSLWTAISITLTENMKKNSSKQLKKDDAVTKESQTDSSTLNKCDSCSTATLCMKNLLQTFENGEGEKISERQLLRPKIYDITQFGCMLQTTTTLENCLNNLFAKLIGKDQEIVALRKENEDLKSEIANKLGKITLLETNVEIFKQKRENDTFKMATISSENEILLRAKKKNELKIRTSEEIIENLHKVVRSYKEKTEILVQEKNNMNLSLNKISQSQMNLIQLNLSMQSKYTAIESKYISMENYLNEAKSTVDVVNNRLNNFTNIFGEIKEKMENIHKGSETNCSYILSKSQEFLERVRKHNKDNFISQANLQNGHVTSFKVKGDPVEDLARQIQENAEKIELLQQENIKLQKIIVKFKKFDK